MSRAHNGWGASRFLGGFGLRGVGARQIGEKLSCKITLASICLAPTDQVLKFRMHPMGEWVRSDFGNRGRRRGIALYGRPASAN